MISKIAPAKVNIFLKVVGKRGFYHELSSRFVRIDSIYDEVSFEKKRGNCDFELEGNFNCQKSDNTITKAYRVLKESGFSKQMDSFFKDYGVHVKKNIPEFSGLGGGSSDSATFMLLCNEVLNLKISKDKLASLGAKVGADVPFFISQYESANVSGIGERVEEFEDDIPKLEIVTPKIQCSTAMVFGAFSKHFEQKNINNSWLKCSSKALLENFDKEMLNDLYLDAIDLYPKLKEYYDKGYYMSGSGSSVFRKKNG